MPINYAILKAELQSDPEKLGYAVHYEKGGDNTVADLLNAVDDAIAIDRGLIPAHEILDATDPDEWSALSADEKQRYQTLVSAGQINTASPNVRSAFQRMFPDGSATGAALIALLTRPGSRAELMFGPGVTVDHGDVAALRRI